jgi:hypothetical protein
MPYKDIKVSIKAASLAIMIHLNYIILSSDHGQKARIRGVIATAYAHCPAT